MILGAGKIKESCELGIRYNLRVGDIMFRVKKMCFKFIPFTDLVRLPNSFIHVTK